MKWVLLPTLVLAQVLLLLGCANTEQELLLPSSSHHYSLGDSKQVSAAKNTLTVISLNLAHGRKENFSQVFISDKTIRHNLLDIAWYFKEHQADIVTLQEADGPSRWSGNFDHVAFLATHSEIPYFARTEHVNAFYGNYGTGVLSRLPVHESSGYNFTRTPPSTRKGFTLTTVDWAISDNAIPVQIDVVSLHLDFLNPFARKKQMQQVLKTISERSNPLIITGDFNSRKIATQYALEIFAERSDLQSYALPDNSLGTYGDNVFDWVLLSPELEFISYSIDDVVLSDHRPVRLEIRYRPANVTSL